MKISTRAELDAAVAQLESLIVTGRAAYAARQQALDVAIARADADPKLNPKDDTDYRAARDAYAVAARDVITLRKDICRADFIDLGGDVVSVVEERPEFMQQLLDYTVAFYTNSPQAVLKRAELVAVDVGALKQ